MNYHTISTVTKFLTRHNLPEEVVYKIIRLFYHEEHQCQLERCFEGIIDTAFSSWGVCHADLEKAVMWFYQCNCCERHSYNKAVIRDNELMIVTKPCVFKGWRYDTEGLYNDCMCDCRQKGRMLARDFLKRKNTVNPYGVMMQNANGTQRRSSLGIRSTLEVQQHHNNLLNGGPDPDDPAYYDYMVEHFPHLVG